MLSELLQALQEWRSPMKFLTCNSLLKYVINFHLYLCICDKLWMHSFRTLLSLPRSPEWGLHWIICMQTQIHMQLHTSPLEVFFCWDSHQPTSFKAATACNICEICFWLMLRSRPVSDTRKNPLLQNASLQHDSYYNSISIQNVTYCEIFLVLTSMYIS